jgi:hypothetical protein
VCISEKYIEFDSGNLRIFEINAENHKTNFVLYAIIFRIFICKMINESFDGMDTPSKKRKRDNFSRFVSSTPIKLANKENFQFSDSLCMEVKSIAELVAERNVSKLPKVNEFEVIRKPPKKKKKNSEDSCFVNPGLDLKVDERVVNPFEVVRSDNTEAILLAKGVSNAALNVADSEQIVAPSKVSTNPFEVFREVELPKDVKGIDNSALELNPPAHMPLMLSLPFTPTVNHRIDFSNMPENLTPCALLATKLVLESNDDSTVIGTPKRSVTVKSRKSLSVISEVSEEVEIDIGEELDNYQLQLENSINEAKMQNRKYEFDAPKTIMEEDEENDETQKSENETVKNETTVLVVNDATYTKELSKFIEESTKEIQNLGPEMLLGLRESNVDDIENFIDDNNEDVQFEEVDSFDDDFGKLGQFKRAYRTDAPPTFKRPTPVEAQPKKMNLGGSIRRSIRKLISHKSDKSEKSNDSGESEKHEGLFQTIRHSLRRKAKPKTTTAPVNLENSIMGRSVFREKSIVEENKKATLEKATLKRTVVKTMKTFMENVEEFDHY